MTATARHQQLISESVDRAHDRRALDADHRVPNLDPILRDAQNLIATIERELRDDELRQAALDAVAQAVSACASCDRVPDVVTTEEKTLQDLRTTKMARAKAAKAPRRAT